MTLTDVRRTILESTNSTLFNDLEETFHFPYMNFSFKVKGVSAIFDFVCKQIDGWEKLGTNIPQVLMSSPKYFQKIKGQIEWFLTNNFQKDEVYINSIWTSEVRSYISNVRSFPLKYNSPEVDFLLKVHDEYPTSVSNAFNFLFNAQTFNFNTKEAVIGALLAYEFSAKEASQIVKRSKTEQSLLKSLRGELEKQISDAEGHLSEHLQHVNEKCDGFVKEIDNLKTEKGKQFGDLIKNAETEVVLFHQKSNEKITTLEKTYVELLSLQKPADYWRERAKELKAEGWLTLKLLIGLVVLSAIILYSLLWLTPEDMMTSFFSEDKSTAVRWSIIFITLISFLAFGIKALTKVTFSSFHLARDAEERERLTYVYLAMVKDANVDREDRQLIMQSLFSRSDTGLLKDDGSPTMPGANTLVDRAIK